MFNRRRAKARRGQKKNGLSNPKSIMALAAGRSHRIFFGKGTGQNLFDKSLQNPNALANFDACVEACDALTASSGRVSSTSVDQFSNEHDFEVSDCSVIVSPDGALLFLPKTETAHGNLINSNSSNASNSSTKSSSDEDIKSTEQDITISRDAETHQNDSTLGRNSPTEELFPGEEFESAIVMGNDMTLGGDKTMNGFSAKGWNPHLATASIRQAVKTLEATGSFVEELILSRKNSAASTSQACDQLRDILIIDNMDEEGIVVTPRKEIKSVESGENQESDARVEGNFSLKTETRNSAALKTSGKNVVLSPSSSNAAASTKSQAGPLLFPGSSLHEALVAMDQYHSKVAEGDARRWRMASLTTGGLPSNEDGALPSVQQAAKRAGERAARREKGIMDMQLILAEAELILKTRKDGTKKLWFDVHKGEAEVNRRLEEMTRERSRRREHTRRKEENERQAAISGGTLTSTVTQQEIWELVSQAAANMDASFAPTGLPAPKSTGPIDKSISPPKSVNSDKDSPRHSLLVDASDARDRIEDELGLNRIRMAAVEAEEDVKDTAGALLNVLSVNDTTKRSACVAAEACLLSSASAQANCLRSLVEIERASIAERLQLIERLEEKINSINVRKDLNKFIEHDKAKVPRGSTRTGEDDDGGIASALAVLNSHSESIGGIGVAGNAEMSSFSGWGDDDDDVIDEVVDREVLETAVEELFTRGKTVDSKKLSASVHILVKAVGEKSVRARGYRASTCYAINQHRGRNTKIYHEEQFEGLCQVLDALLTGCDRESADVASAKMIMMLAQTFYITRETDGEGSEAKVKRSYPNVKLCNHLIWSDEDFWVQALFQCVTESLSQSGVILQVRVKKSESPRKMKWHDLSLDERAEAASQVHAVIFAQLGALAHSMIEFGCTVEQAIAFVRRLSVRHQLPLSQRTMLLSHLTQQQQNLKV